VDLLRVLQERRFYRVGGSEEIPVDVRVIAATHRDLEGAVREGKFRDDLFYRLNVINVRIPPLRERLCDVPLLARTFLDRISHELGKPVDDITEGALGVLLEHEWPGNVRELENAVERAIVTCRTRILSEDEFAFLKRAAAPAAPLTIPAGLTLEELEHQAIAATLERAGGNVKESAAALGIDRSTLYEKIKKYAIPR
jgi:two-component system response regulator HydG